MVITRLNESQVEINGIEGYMNKKKIIYVDLDDTLCDYQGAFKKVKESEPDLKFPQSQPGFYESLKPLPDAIDAFKWLCKQEHFDVYILTAPSLYNPLCYMEKRRWVEFYLGFEHVNRLIISYHKNLLLGDYLIDDRVEGRGQEDFTGELIQFGSSGLETWREIKRHISKNIINKTQSETEIVQQHSDILCFSAFDLQDHFAQPVASFKEAIELLLSERAYLPDQALSAEALEKKQKDDADTLLFFKTRFDDLKNPKRWVITCRDYGLTAITGNAYFDVVNNHWTPKISDATCIKDKNIADAIIESFGEDSNANVIEHYVSQKELAKTAIQLENDPAVIHYQSETDTYLYEERNYFSDYETHAMISLSNPDQFTIQKNHPAPCQIYVSIPDIVMDELATAWCKHRNIEVNFK